MYLFKSCAIAISMYSKIPMPTVEWNKKNMKYTLCFFPIVGVILAVAEILLGTLLLRLGVGTLFFATVMTLLPILITGGIHMDGFMDTIDALSSYGDREKKLSILKDPHAGAFAILGAVCYFLWNIALWSEIKLEMIPIVGCGYVLSRSMSGYSVVAFVAARDSGLAKTFQDHAHKTVVRIVMLAIIILTSMAMVVLNPLLGGVAIVASLGIFLYYKSVCDKHFGGLTGDLAGYFLQFCELGILTTIVLAGGF